MASFADPADLIVHYDSRRVCQLASDNNAPIAVGDIDTDPVVLAMLARATETILSHVRKGDKYSEEELQALADSATSGAMLTGLTCDLAFAYLVMRRGTGASDLDRLSPHYRMALQTLEDIAAGSEVFARIDGDEHEDAGTPRTADLRRQTTTPQPGCSWSQTATSRLLPGSPNNDPYGCC
jgi:phage gp36-like protein